MKKVILMLAIAALLVTVAGPAQAELKWYNATITYAGLLTTQADTIFISADSTDEVWVGSRWFVATGSESKAVLATALSAWSMGAPIIIVLDDASLAEFSPCYGILAAPAP